MLSSHFQGRSLRPLWQSTGGATALLLHPSTKTCPLLDGQIETQSSRGGCLQLETIYRGESHLHTFVSGQYPSFKQNLPCDIK